MTISALGCDEDSTRPVFQDVGYIAGQVIWDDEDPPPTVVIERRGEFSYRMEIDLDENGRFSTPLSDGTYFVGLSPVGGSSVEGWLTRDGFTSRYDSVPSRIPVIRGTTTDVTGTLGRLSLDIDTQIDVDGTWRLDVDPLVTQFGLGSRFIRMPTDRGMLTLDVLRLALGPYRVSVRTPFDEGFELEPIRNGETGTVQAELHPTDPYTIVLPTPTLVSIRTSEIVGAPLSAFSSLLVAADPLLGDDATTTLAIDDDRSFAWGQIYLYNRVPFRIRYYYSYTYDAWVGSLDEAGATLFEANPGGEVEATIEVGLVRLDFLGVGGSRHLRESED
ncbi:MAG: hypothetical protein R3E97_16065 [Candidatus Eisenbacteria bacterium]